MRHSLEPLRGFNRPRWICQLPSDFFGRHHFCYTTIRLPVRGRSWSSNCFGAVTLLTVGLSEFNHEHRLPVVGLDFPGNRGTGVTRMRKSERCQGSAASFFGFSSMPSEHAPPPFFGTSRTLLSYLPVNASIEFVLLGDRSGLRLPKKQWADGKNSKNQDQNEWKNDQKG